MRNSKLNWYGLTTHTKTFQHVVFLKAVTLVYLRSKYLGAVLCFLCFELSSLGVAG